MSTFAEDYLDGYGGSSRDYRANLTRGQRLGQAFFNALSKADRDLLIGTDFDPYHSVVHGPALLRTINYLLNKKGG